MYASDDTSTPKDPKEVKDSVKKVEKAEKAEKTDKTPVETAPTEKVAADRASATESAKPEVPVVPLTAARSVAPQRMQRTLPPRPTGHTSSRSMGRPSMGRSPMRSTRSRSVYTDDIDDDMEFGNEAGFGQNGHSHGSSNNSQVITGYLDTSRDGHGVIRAGFGSSEQDAYISNSLIKRFKIRPGDLVVGPAREPKDNERYWGMIQVDSVNGLVPAEQAAQKRTKFYQLTPVYPDEKIVLETGKDLLDLRIIDLVAPIGKGQRSLIVSPPKAGKTTLLKNIASGVATNLPEAHLMAVLVGERPEEATDIKRHIALITKSKGEVAASNFDESPETQTRVAELALERAKRLVEMGKDVVMLLDSITRLARAYNLAIPTSGRTLSGGFDPAALHPPKRFFGAARNFEVPGSLTIIGTALVDTGSRMDDLIYEEFKGTGNQEVHLERRLAERRIFPAIDVQRSGTRRDDLLSDSITYQSVLTLHRMLDTLDREERTPTLIQQLSRTNSNKEFLAFLKAG